ncbi:ABC transporter [Zobellella denitrificans]|jgi:putative ABC transport system ATP-binding protein|uniref:ABC transporter n=1 Tax=Zobellella denitrificans TaxID=347534 RepID=A0A231MUC9_9GAMM|nr:ABC transporter ATP-binding protein [Zobellella denitrificans]ATG73092.1 ABC transporter [Zobellella denitrificans]OXS13781.1 ABC transporter [Zobellella denitrificans]
MTTSPIIRVAGLTHRVGLGDTSLTILQGIGLEVKPGQSLALVGASGSGKSTLLGLLAGLDIASEGDIEIRGQSLAALDEEQRALLRARHIGFVFQSFLLLPTLTALENVMLPAELQGRSQCRERALQLLAQVGLAERVRHFPSQLSGGEQQRVAIARAFMTEPDILLADEPTGNLDHHTGAQIIELLFRLNREHGTTLVIVTHDEALAGRCERRLLMSAGRLEEQHAES